MPRRRRIGQIGRSRARAQRRFPANTDPHGMKVLGISAFYHDSAAALIEDGRIIAAAQEERFSRRRHDARFPSCAIAFCLQFARTRVEDVDFVVFYEKPYLKFERLLETYVDFAPRGLASFAKAMPLWIHEKLFLRRFLVKELSELSEKIDWDSRLMFSEHHYSHAASAFFPSPFSEAAILTIDGVGEWATTSLALGNDTRIEMLREIRFPHSRSEEHTSELQSQFHLVCRLLLEKKKKKTKTFSLLKKKKKNKKMY